MSSSTSSSSTPSTLLSSSTLSSLPSGTFLRELYAYFGSRDTNRYMQRSWSVVLGERHRVALRDQRHQVHVRLQPPHELKVDALEPVRRDKIETDVHEPVALHAPAGHNGNIHDRRRGTGGRMRGQAQPALHARPPFLTHIFSSQKNFTCPEPGLISVHK